jgi:hypothetical protein
MKKALLILITLFNAFALQAEDAHRIITFEELPIKAQEFVTTYFSSQTIRFVRMEIEVTKTEYTVRFENGMEIEFNSNGDWEEVESHSECLPSGFLSEMILNFLNKNHPNYCLNEIARDRHKIEVELANGLEIVFNKSGEFLRYDD